MNIKPKVASSIVQGLAVLGKCQELADFTVMIGNDEFKCHRFILAACSEFFQALFRSGMKETEQKCVTIKEISSETFKLILEAIYTGNAVLTNENVIDIWRAAHQLQIHFLVSECERYIIENMSLDNYIEYLYTSKAFFSDVVLEAVWSFILKNCHAFFQTNCFLELPLADVTALIKSQDLKTKSEDEVIDAILKWAEFQDHCPHFSGVTLDGIPNRDTMKRNKDNESDSDGEPSRKKSKTCQDNLTLIGSLDNNVPTKSTSDILNETDVTNEDVRHDNFTMLLSHARTFLASQRYLQFLINHPLVKENKEARNIVKNALMYQMHVGKRNEHWPFRTLQRGNGDSIHCIVGAHWDGSDVHFKAYSMTSKQCFRLPGRNYIQNIKIAAGDTKLYSLYTEKFHPYNNRQINVVNRSRRLYLIQFLTDSWLQVKLYLNLKSDNFNVALVDLFLYIFSAVDQKVWKIDPGTGKHMKVSNLSVQDTIAYVIAYDQRILVFCTSTAVGVEETVVWCYDTSENTWNQLTKFAGSANGMTSFQDNFTYLLQSNGNLWKVDQSQSNVIVIEFVIKLWNCIWPVHGAFMFFGDLYISVRPENPQIDPQLMRSLPGVFKEIIYHDTTYFGNSGVTPYIFNGNDFDNHLLPVKFESRFIKQL